MSIHDLSVKSKMSSSVGFCAFIILFPGYFIYNVLVGMGYIFGILRGYWTPLAIILLPILIYYYKEKILFSSESKKIDATFFLFMIYFLGIVVLGLFISNNNEVIFSQMAVVIQVTTIFLSIRLMDFKSLRLKNNKLLIIMIFILSAMTIINSTNNSFSLGSLKDSSLSDSGKLANYQGYAQTYLVTVFFCIPFVMKFFNRVILFCIAIVCLTIIGARSEMLVFVIFAMIVEFCLLRFKLFFISILFSLVSFVLFAKDFLLEMIVDYVPNTRLLSLFELQNDQSILARKEMFNSALETIMNHPLLGSYASYDSGHYAHNVFSAWVDLGFVGFCWYILLLIIPLLNLLINFDSKSREFILTLSVCVFVILMCLFSKPFTNLYFPVMLGIYANYLNLHQQRTIDVKLGQKLVFKL